MNPAAKTILIVCALTLGLPCISCSGLLLISAVIQATKSPEQRERERAEEATKAHALKSQQEAEAKQARAEQSKRTAEANRRSYEEAMRPKPTMVNYHRVQDGMSYQQVVAIVGKPSQELSRSSFGEIETVMFMWQSGKLGGNMNVTFQNNRVIGKAQLNLP